MTAFLARFAEAVARDPAAPALRAFGRTTSYDDLDALRRGFAAGLTRECGVGESAPVALFLPASPYAPAALLGAWTAGQPVLMLPPAAPAADLAARIRSSGATIAVTVDIGAIHDKARRAVADTAVRRLVVGRMTDILPFPRNVLLPLMRGAGLATLVPDRMTVTWRDFAAPARTPSGGRAAIGALIDGAGTRHEPGDLEARAAALAADLPAEGPVFLAARPEDPGAGPAMLAALSDGRTLVLAPRLDGPSLAGQLARERPAVVLAGEDAPADLVAPPGARLQRL